MSTKTQKLVLKGHGNFSVKYPSDSYGYFFYEGSLYFSIPIVPHLVLAVTAVAMTSIGCLPAGGTIKPQTANHSARVDCEENIRKVQRTSFRPFPAPVSLRI